MTRSFKEPVFLVSTEFRLNERLAAKAIEIARATVERARARGSSPPAPLFPAIEDKKPSAEVCADCKGTKVTDPGYHDVSYHTCKGTGEVPGVEEGANSNIVSVSVEGMIPMSSITPRAWLRIAPAARPHRPGDNDTR
jgi:hypothetical protein